MSDSTFEDRLPILQLGRLEIDFRRYSYVPVDFSNYFPPYEAHDWEYRWRVDPDGETFAENGVRCRTPLWVVLQRLNLLGWTEEVARLLYEESQESSEKSRRLFPRLTLPPLPTFDVLAQGVASLDVEQVRDGHEPKGATSPWQIAASYAVEFDNGGVVTEHAPDPVQWYRHQIENLDTATIMHMLAMNSSNLDLPVTWWAYNEVIYGQLGEDDYVEQIGAKYDDRVMIVTEGKSDKNIIKKALSMLRPHVEDFFTFVDMSENYPFTGVGNLSNFYKGLHKIGIQNNVIVLFDNDAEGDAKFEDAKRLHELPNIRPLKVPDIPSLVHFQTISPTGEQNADINGRAASIDCLLDLEWKAERKASIRWTSFLKSRGTYQGELIDKAEYAKRFLALSADQRATYDTSNIETLLNGISALAEEMATHILLHEE